MKKKRLILFIPLFLIFVLFLIRLFSQTQIDDVSPEIPCPEIQKYNPDILWIIPEFNNIPISKNQTWCNSILNLNKTLEIHGITHEYDEFVTNKSQEELEQGIKIFEDCFGFKPTEFKPSQLKISNENKKLIKQNNLQLKIYFNQMTHKVYHCNDSDKTKNWMVNLF